MSWATVTVERLGPSAVLSILRRRSVRLFPFDGRVFLSQCLARVQHIIPARSHGELEFLLSVADYLQLLEAVKKSFELLAEDASDGCLCGFS